MYGLDLNIMFVFVARGRPGKSVQLAESEVRGLCLKSREIFLNQPILLELEAPLKICGKFVYVNAGGLLLFNLILTVLSFAN